MTAALLRKGMARLDDGATPIVVIDNPEAQLHPMTAAAALSLFDQIKWQKLIGTHSGDLLSLAPLHAIRRLTRRDGTVHAWHVRPTRSIGTIYGAA